MKKSGTKIVSITKILPSYIYSMTIASVLYIIVFLTLYFYLQNTPISISTFWDFHLQHPVLFYIELLPFLVYFFIYYIVTDLSKNIRDIEQEIAWLNSKNRAIFNFVEQLRKGNTEIGFSNEFIQDRVVQSLIALRDEIKQARQEDEKRRREEEQRNWINRGLAEFSNILRENVDDLDKLAEKVTSYLTRYMDAKQAAFFVTREEKGEKYLEMIAFFAYDRKKFPDKKLMWGEGLIGAAAIEKNVVVLNDTTEDFVEVTSGLGGANPRSILISPLIDEEGEVHGVLELASFSRFEQYHVEFIEQISKSIAATLANVKRNLQTQQLLKESQKQAEILAQQEEKMRKSMTELQMLQEEAAKQSEEFISFTNSVNRALLRAEFNRDGFLIYANDKFIKALDYTDYFEIANKHFTTFLHDSEKDLFDQLWDNIINKEEVFDGDLHFISYNGQDRWISSAIIAVKSKEGELLKILFLGLNRTAEKKLVEEQLAVMRFSDNLLVRMTLSLDGRITDVNNNLLTILGLNKEDVLNKEIVELLSIEEAQEFTIAWRSIATGKAHVTTHKFTTGYNTSVWIEAYYFAYIVEGNIESIMMIGVDVSDMVKAQRAVKAKEEEISRKEEEIERLQARFEAAREKLEHRLRIENIGRNLFVNVFEQLNQAVVAIDETEHIVLFNKNAEELWKVKRDVVLGKRLSAILPELPEPIGIDDVEYLLEYFNVSRPLLNTSRLSYIVDKAGNRVNISIYIVKSEFESKALVTAFIQNMES